MTVPHVLESQPLTGGFVRFDEVPSPPPPQAVTVSSARAARMDRIMGACPFS